MIRAGAGTGKTYTITAADFGSLLPDDHRREVHELLAHVIPEAERQYAEELRQNNRVHLSNMMSMLHRSSPTNRAIPVSGS